MLKKRLLRWQNLSVGLTLAERFVECGGFFLLCEPKKVNFFEKRC